MGFCLTKSARSRRIFTRKRAAGRAKPAPLLWKHRRAFVSPGRDRRRPSRPPRTAAAHSHNRGWMISFDEDLLAVFHRRASARCARPPRRCGRIGFPARACRVAALLAAPLPGGTAPQKIEARALSLRGNLLDSPRRRLLPLTVDHRSPLPRRCDGRLLSAPAAQRRPTGGATAFNAATGGEPSLGGGPRRLTRDD